MRIARLHDLFRHGLPDIPGSSPDGADLPSLFPSDATSAPLVVPDADCTAVSAYLTEIAPGQPCGPHAYPYGQIAFVQRGRARWQVRGTGSEAGPGDVVVVGAGECYSVRVIGEEPLVHLSLHLTSRCATPVPPSCAVESEPFAGARSATAWPVTAWGWIALLAQGGTK